MNMFTNDPAYAFLVIVLGTLLQISFSGSNTEDVIHRRRRQTSNKQGALKGGVCVLPRPLHNGQYKPSEKRCPTGDDTPACLMLAGAFVPPEWVLYYECDRGYVQDSTKTFAVCANNAWLPRLPVCNKLCPPLRSQSLDLTCMFGGNKVSCDQQMRPGTVATQQCKEYYHPIYEPESDKLTCLDSGIWNYPLSDCEPDDICKADGDTLWACKKITQCPKAQEGLKNRIIPETCYVSNKDPYICCEPQIDERIVEPMTTAQPVRKSIRMCEKYAESVFVSASMPDGDYKVDTCGLVEPIDAPLPQDPDDTPELPSNAEPREFPHIAVIGYGEKSYKRPAVRCVGSLISERYVLSLVTCSQTHSGPAAWVRLGDYNVNSNRDDNETDSQTVIIDIEKRIEHPDYKKTADPNDIVYNNIALLKLKVDVKFNEYIRPICLYAGDQFAKTFSLTTGWGPRESGERPSDILQKVNLTIVEDEKCSDNYKFYGKETNGLNTSLVVCASLLNGHDTCMILQGSPLQIRLRDPYCMYSLVGVAYFGRPCFVKSPSVYNRVSHYLDWIESIVWP